MKGGGCLRMVAAQRMESRLIGVFFFEAFELFVNQNDHLRANQFGNFGVVLGLLFQELKHVLFADFHSHMHLVGAVVHLANLFADFTNISDGRVCDFPGKGLETFDGFRGLVANEFAGVVVGHNFEVGFHLLCERFS